MMRVSITDRLPDKDCAALVTDGRHVALADWTERDGWVLDRGNKTFGITATPSESLHASASFYHG